MPRKRKEPVERVCENCGVVFETRLPGRARFCPGSKCRSEAWNKRHWVESKEDFAREAVRLLAQDKTGVAGEQATSPARQ
ncbi:MAG TPA: hypothetical protein VF611_01355 [Pyrinomonadaceae bacterium]|jgi:hypothetical protein